MLAIVEIENGGQVHDRVRREEVADSALLSVPALTRLDSRFLSLVINRLVDFARPKFGLFMARDRGVGYSLRAWNAMSLAEIMAVMSTGNPRMESITLAADLPDADISARVSDIVTTMPASRKSTKHRTGALKWIMRTGNQQPR